MTERTVKEETTSQENLTRRAFLTGAGMTVAGGALTLMSCAKPTAAQAPECPEAEAEEVEVVKEVPEWPWPYVALDPEVVRKKGHLGYYDAACCYGAFWSIVDTLREEIGFPYTQFPVAMLRFGEGGMAGWATTCGALIGSSAAINLVCDEEGTKQLVHELVGWYTQTPFPSEISNQYAADHEFLVAEYKTDQVLPANVSNSPLCHASVGKWCENAGFASGSKERSERCGRLTADVAAHAVELLNQYHSGQFEPVFTFSKEVELCRTCHFKGKEFEIGQFTRGKMDCTGCHTAVPHQIDGDLLEKARQAK